MKRDDKRDERDEAFKLAVDLVAGGLMQRPLAADGRQVPVSIEEVRRRLDSVQDGIEEMLARRRAETK